MNKNNIMFIIITILLIIIITFHITLKKICDVEPEFYKYGNNNNFTILIIGSTHGNEPAGHHIIKNLMNKLNSQQIILKNINLILVPTVNYCGFKLNKRHNYLLNDINRQYKSNDKINKKILELVDNSDFIIDFHEGYDFHQIDNNSLGSTIGLTKWNGYIDLQNTILNNVNKDIHDKKQFVSIDLDKNDYDGTLSEYAKNNNKKYLLVELSGQNGIQHMDIRVYQGLQILQTVFNHFSN